MLSRLRYQHVDVNDTFNLLPVRLVIIQTMFYSIWLKDIKTTINFFRFKYISGRLSTFKGRYQ